MELIILLYITDLPIRLANGTNEKEGRVEIYWNDQWSTVCDDIWDDNAATVICKQLGYSRGSARVSAYFGEGSGLIILDDVDCNGRESSIFACNHRTFGEHDCTHIEVAGVVCYGESSKGGSILIYTNLLFCIACSETSSRQFK